MRVAEVNGGPGAVTGSHLTAELEAIRCETARSGEYSVGR
jgi:hypothetical protein